MGLNEKLIALCTENFAYYKSKYNKNFSNMLNYSLIDTKDMIGGLISGVPNTSYSECTSLLEITKIKNPKILRIAGVLAVILSFVGVFTGFLQSIPASVIGAMSLYLYVMISWVGVKNIKNERDNKGKFKVTDIIVMVVMFIVGIGNTVGLNIAIQIGNVALSGLSLAIIVGILLNAILTKFIK